MALFNSREPYEPTDMVCIYKDDGTADIAPVTSINDERIFAQSASSNYSIPLGDVKSYTGPQGRIFLYPSTIENVTDCQRIAALERSTVLRQITHFADRGAIEEPMKMSKMKLILIGGAVVLLLILLLK